MLNTQENNRNALLICWTDDYYVKRNNYSVQKNIKKTLKSSWKISCKWCVNFRVLFDWMTSAHDILSHSIEFLISGTCTRHLCAANFAQLYHFCAFFFLQKLFYWWRNDQMPTLHGQIATAAAVAFNKSILKQYSNKNIPF